MQSLLPNRVAFQGLSPWLVHKLSMAVIGARVRADVTKPSFPTLVSILAPALRSRLKILLSWIDDQLARLRMS